MRTLDFATSAPGRLVRQSGSQGEFYAYVPEPLPPALVLDMGTIRRLADAAVALGELKGIGRMLPNPHLLIGPFVRREAVASSRIEGTITDLRQLVVFEAEPSGQPAEDDDAQEVKNYVESLNYGLKRLEQLPLSLRLLRELHERLMAEVRGEDQMPGQFRSRQNMIGRAGQTPAEARFVPPPVIEMHAALDALEKYLARPSGLPDLVDLALIHYQFEAIHPFLDGNGRVGRLLISLLLRERRLLDQPVLYLSTYFERHRETYTDLLLAVSQRGEWPAWIDFFLTGVSGQARQAIRRAHDLLALRQEYHEAVRASSRSATASRLVDLLFEQPAVTVNQVARALQVTFRSASLAVADFEARNILVEVTGKARNRIYLAQEIVRRIQTDDPDDEARGFAAP